LNRFARGLDRMRSKPRAKRTKSFLLLFFKKEVLAYFSKTFASSRIGTS
jgi:hypothetical protein